jgi:hypothetical protein
MMTETALLAVTQFIREGVAHRGGYRATNVHSRFGDGSLGCWARAHCVEVVPSVDPVSPRVASVGKRRDYTDRYCLGEHESFSSLAEADKSRWMARVSYVPSQSLQRV